MRRLLLAALLATPLAHAQIAQDTVTNPAPGVPGLVGVSVPEGIASAPLLFANGTFISQPTGGGPSGTDPVSVLTAPGCGMGEILVDDVRSKLRALPGIGEAQVELTFDPPWHQGMMSEAARLQTGLY